MKTSAMSGSERTPAAIAGVLAVLIATALLMIFLYAPTEATMGEVQRIVYLHVAVAWFGLAGFAASAACAALYLARRRLAWDHWAQACAETGWLCTTLTLATGSLWAHEAWNTWWTWEPRLTSSLVLWLIYAGTMLVRSGVDEPHRRARTGALLTILGLVDLPFVLMATRWFRGVHPVTPEMDPRMRLVLLVAVASFTIFFAGLVMQRRRQLENAERVATREAEVEMGS
jgi:heme exporter protein C